MIRPSIQTILQDILSFSGLNPGRSSKDIEASKVCSRELLLMIRNVDTTFYMLSLLVRQNAILLMW